MSLKPIIGVKVSSQRTSGQILRDVSALRATSLLSLFESGAFTDCTVTCGEKKWNCHKFLLCSQSSFFKAAFEGAFKEGQDSVVDLSAEDSEMVNWLLFTLYGRTFEVDWHGEANKDEEIDRWDTQLLYFGRLYALAHRLDVTAVAGLAVVEYRNWFEPVGDATTSLLPDLVKIAYEDLPEDDRALKDPLVKYIRQHMAQIKGNVDASKELQEIISTTAQLGWDLLR